MNHVVPELDATGMEMDVICEPTDMFSLSKGKRDSRETKKPDYGFVPENDLQELYWEDGQLLVVMQGLNNKGNPNKRSCWQVRGGEMAGPDIELPTVGMDTAFDALGSEDLMDLPTINMQTEEDDLLTWLQQAPEVLADTCEIVSDTIIATGPDCKRLYHSDLVKSGISHTFANPEDLGKGPKLCRNDTGVALPLKGVHYGGTNQQVPNNIPKTTPHVPCPWTTKLGTPPPLANSLTVTQSMTVHIPCAQAVPSGSTTAMNFQNFSRPAVSIKANLHSLGMASGPSGAERVRLFDRGAVDASKSIHSRIKPFRLIAPRREETILPSRMGSVEASTVCNPTQTYPVDRESEQAVTATGVFNGCSGVRGQSDGWNSSIIGSTGVGTERTMEALRSMEHSAACSSGESEDSEGVCRKRAADKGKRKICYEDSEIQSNVALVSKSHTAVAENLKRRRAAVNHNQSERRRRDRISEKMKILQSLVPNAHKTDKASMLEEAISYIKALKAHIQMMSYVSGSYFTPMHMPHVQMTPQWAQMSMGIGMNMGMGLNAGMGMINMTSATSAATLQQFSPMFEFSGAVYPTTHTTTTVAPNSVRPTHVTVNHGVPHSAHHSANQMLVHVRPGNMAASQKEQPVQERLATV